MKKQIYTLFTILNLLVTLALVPAQAQHPGTLVANIPFAFMVGEKTLPAGEYTIKLPAASGMRSRVLIRSVDGESACIALTIPVQAKGNVKEPKLTFVKYGDQHFLFQVFAPGIDVGQEVPESKNAERLAKAQVARQVVSLTGSKK